MRSKRHWAVLIGLFLALAFLVLLTVRQQGVETGVPSPMARSSYSARPPGTKALYRTLEALGYRVERWRKPWRLLNLKERRIVLFVVEPMTGVFPKSDDWQRLVQFVAAGNVVWLAAEDPETVRGDIFSARPTKVLLRTFPVSEARPLFPAAWLRGVRRCEVNSITRLTKRWRLPNGKSPELLQKAVEIPLLADQHGVVLKAIVMGDGLLLVDSNPHALSNEAISKHDHLRLVLNVVSSVAGEKGTVLFDEWGRGLGVGEHWWWVVSPNTRGAIVQLLVAGIVVLVALSVRFGRPVQLPPQPFSRTAFVHGLATLLQRGNTLPEVIALLQLHFLRQALRQPTLWRLPSSNELERALQALPPNDRSAIRRIWQWAEKLRRLPRISERDALKWAQAAHETLAQLARRKGGWER